jgi:hypothetical protein
MQTIKSLTTKLLVLGLGAALTVGFTSTVQAHGGGYYKKCFKCHYRPVKHVRYRHVVRVVYPACNTCTNRCFSCNYCTNWGCNTCCGYGGYGYGYGY